MQDPKSIFCFELYAEKPTLEQNVAKVRQEENLLETKFHGKWVATATEKKEVEDEGYFFGYPTAA